MACDLGEAVDHIVSAIRKPRDMSAHAWFISLFCLQSRTPTHGLATLRCSSHFITY